jgi:AraC family transcriptional regulator
MMEIIRRTFFEGETLRIGFFEAHPVSDACGEIEQQSADAIVLPVSGVFSKHDAPGRSVIGTPSHAVFVGAERPYRLSFPGAIGDRALVLRYGEPLAPEQTDGESAAPHGLLVADAMILRNLLWRRLDGGDVDPFEIEALGLDLLNMSLRAMGAVAACPRRSTLARRRLALERVKEAVAQAPADKWSVRELARIANLSPFHLCRVFHQMVGISLYDYVLRERLACALAAVLDGANDLTAVALDAGFSSHSHFTERFRRFFGWTPTALRRMARTRHINELRKIMTARRSELAVM